MKPPVLRQCAGCFAERLCRQYRGHYYCVKPPNLCWRKREALYRELRRKEAGKRG